MQNIDARITEKPGKMIRDRWFLLTVILFIVPAGRSSSQEPDRLTGPLFMESVWISTDRNIYLPGEEINFSAIVLETDNYYPSILSRILKVELIDNKGNRLVQQEFYLENSRVNQNISIPPSCTSNWYFLRAYTNWMRNSQEAMKIFLPLKIVKPENFSIREGNYNLSGLHAFVFPENEHLVAGRINHCAVQIVSTDGDNIETEAALLSSRKDTLVRFITDNTGWGVFSFTPTTEDQYSIVVPGNRKSNIDTKFPEVLIGVPYATIIKEADFIKLSIVNVTTDSVKMLIHRNYTLFEYTTADAGNGTALFSIPASRLPEGIVQFTLLSDDNDILFKRLYCKNNPVGSRPEIFIDRSEHNRGLVTVEIITGTDVASGNQLVNTIVSREEPVDPFDLYMPGIPGWHFSYDIPVNPSSLNGWLIANGYPDEVVRSFFRNDGTGLLSWSENKMIMIDDRESLYDFLPQTRGFTVTGRIIDGSGAPVPNFPVAATLLGDNSFYAGFTFRSGKFYMTVPDRTGLEDVVVSFTSKPEPDWALIIDSQFDTTSITLPTKNFTITSQEAEYIRDLDINRQLVAIYRNREQKINEETLSLSNPISFFGIPDRITMVDDFIKLPNIREVLFEVVPGVSVRKSGGSFKVGIYGDQPLPSFYSPLFLLDGIPIFDFDEFLELPSDRFQEIRQINNLYIHGNAVFSGIVSFHSVNNDLAGLDLPGKSLFLTMELPSQGLTRNSPEKTQYGGNIPALSNTLYWKSFLNSDIGKFSFAANDNLGTFIGRVTGFNENGQWICNKKTITIGTDAKKDRD